MLQKILAIAWTNLYITYTDRRALLLIILAPVALSTLIGLAFGQSEGDIELEKTQVLVINQDQAVETEFSGDQEWGQTYADILTENDPEGLGKVLMGTTAEDVETARQQVESGEVDALVYIPSDFTAQVNAADQQGQVELYYNPGDEIKATVILSVVEGITAQLNTGKVGEKILVGDTQNGGYLVTQALGAGKPDAIGQAAETALTALYTNATTSGVTLNAVNVTGETEAFDALQYFAPSMAILFMTFTMAGGTRGILEESHNGTLQRIMTTPTPRWVFMVGKLLGTYASGCCQMLILLLVMPLVATLMGRNASIWGDNYPAILLITLGVVGAATGLGLLLAAVSSNPRQAENISSGLLVVMAMVSGTFVPVENVAVLDALSKLTLNHWAITGYTALSADNASLGDILPNVGAMVLMTVCFFGVALWRFNRRLDI